MLGACLVAGNTAVFKPSPQSGLTAALLMETAEAAGLPAGVLNMINGEEAGPLLVDADGIDGVAFTGSHQTGMRIFRKLASGPYARPVICEMGGKNPAYVTAKADLDHRGGRPHPLGLRAPGREMLGLFGRLCRELRCMGAFLERLKERAEAIASAIRKTAQSSWGR